MSKFIISKETIVENFDPANSVLNNAANILRRDISKVVKGSGDSNQIQLIKKRLNHLTGDQFEIIQINQKTLLIQGNTSLSVMYGVLAVSREYLGIDDSWYFLDICPKKRETIEIESPNLSLPSFRVKYRGWFINDEVMISQWKDHNSQEYVWERIYETLLRFGGNVIIPGTDKNSHLNRSTASAFGLIIAHHHAEPLGAEMFSRVYPDLEDSYLKHPDKFETLWRSSIKEQKDDKVIWSLGFRGQGDRAFWLDDTSKVWTEQEKADVINKVINLQYSLVKEADPSAICAVNIYGELAQMFHEDLLILPKDIIEIWADNGYGKMVSRRGVRQDLRLPVLSVENKLGNPRGIYYHVAFHDLQSSNFLTKLPNSPEFVSSELTKVKSANMDTLVICNTGNIKPHILFLQEVAKFWLTDYAKRTNDEILTDYMKYYPGEYKNQIKEMYLNLFNSFIQYGEHKDQKAGDEFYTYTIRKYVQSILRNSSKLEDMELLTGDTNIEQQSKQISSLLDTKADKFNELYYQANSLYQILLMKNFDLAKRFYNDLLLDVIVHHYAGVALSLVIKTYEAYAKNDLITAFLKATQAKNSIDTILSARKSNPSSKWQDFYDNDVFTNIGLTSRMLETLIQFIRTVGDNHEQYEWEREYLMEYGDSVVMLLSNNHDALSNDYLALKLQEVFAE